MKKQMIIGVAIVVMVFALAGCSAIGGLGAASAGTDTGTNTTTGVNDYASFVSWIKGEGATVEEVGPFTQTFFDTQGKTVRIDGENVQVFEFADGSTMDQIAQQVLPDGSSVGTFTVDTIATPHFFKSGRIIVLYMGDNTKITSLLEKGLGKQFAGG